MILHPPSLVSQHPAPKSLMVLFSACSLILGRLCGWIHWLLWSCLFSPSHHPKCFRPTLQHLGHTPEQSLLSPGCLPELSHHCFHCLSSSALPVTNAQADPLSSSACLSSPVIILLATVIASLLPVTTSGNGFGCQPGTCFSPTLTTTPQSTDKVVVLFFFNMQPLLWLLAEIPAPHYD